MCILSVGIPVVIRRTFVPSPIHHFPAHASSESPIYTLHALASLPRPCDRFGDQRRENLLSEIHTSATLLLIALSLACLLSLSPFRPPFFLVPSFVCLFFSFGTFSFPFFFFFLSCSLVPFRMLSIASLCLSILLLRSWRHCIRRNVQNHFHDRQLAQARAAAPWCKKREQH